MLRTGMMLRYLHQNQNLRIAVKNSGERSYPAPSPITLSTPHRRHMAVYPTSAHSLILPNLQAEGNALEACAPFAVSF